MENFNQVDFLKMLSAHLKPGYGLSDWLSDSLGIDRSTASKKMRNESKLSIHELAIICAAIPEAFALLPTYMGLPHHFVALFNGFKNEQELQINMKRTLGLFDKISQGQNELKYVGRDLSYFFFLSRPALFEFKISVWTNSILTDGIVPLSDSTQEIAQELMQAYRQVNSVELWNDSGIYNLKRQMDYTLMVGKLSENDYKKIQADIMEALNEFEQMADMGNKGAAMGKFDLYGSSYCTMSNGGLVTTPDLEMLLTASVGVQLISTTFPEMVQSFKEHWIGNMKTAKLLSMANTAERVAFFDFLRKAMKYSSKDGR
jgi:hypothetical protein